ncbi:DUF1249 domain-containing protein [Solimonas terrae]|nr:DUF1249 domain-containing protein [Solimonas terrae]
MQATTHLCPCCGKPRSIAHLLELYERNYRMLLRLLPELDGHATRQRAVSRSEHDCPLHLEVVERDRYTQTLRLTYEFTDESGVRRQPDLWVRLYRDAAVAEALQCSQRPPWQAEDDADPAAHAFLSAQWRRNLLLNKWLDYLLERGHAFDPQPLPAVETVPV